MITFCELTQDACYNTADDSTHIRDQSEVVFCLIFQPEMNRRNFSGCTSIGLSVVLSGFQSQLSLLNQDVLG